MKVYSCPLAQWGIGQFIYLVVLPLLPRRTNEIHCIARRVQESTNNRILRRFVPSARHPARQFGPPAVSASDHGTRWYWRTYRIQPRSPPTSNRLVLGIHAGQWHGDRPRHAQGMVLQAGQTRGGTEEGRSGFFSPSGR